MLIRLVGKFFLSSILFFLFFSNNLFAAECGGKYVVKTGDTLSSIASEYYQDVFLFSLIFDANRDTLSDPSKIYKGNKIDIPCLVEEKIETSLKVTSKRVQNKNSNRTIDIVVAKGFPPFTYAEGEKEGGMTTQIVKESFSSSKYTVQYNIDWINDFDSHFPLMLSGKYDMSYPWYKPTDCNHENKNNFSDNTKDRCSNFLFSEPLYETLTAFYRNKDSQRNIPGNYKDLHGSKICRAKGYYTFDLEEEGLNEKNITLIRPGSIEDCFKLLLRKKVDYVAHNSFSSRNTIRKLEIEDRMVAVSSLQKSIGMHLLVAKSHPDAETLIHKFNDGLIELERKGRLKKVQSQHIINDLISSQ
jgi:polar amino acid transport system substrate-binding protein